MRPPRCGHHSTASSARLGARSSGDCSGSARSISGGTCASAGRRLSGLRGVQEGRAAATGGDDLPSDLHFTCVNNIPTARGLGSSSAALVSGLAAGLVLAGRDVSKPNVRLQLLQLAADAEGHPDNVAPAIYGGFQIAINTGKQWVTQSVAMPESLQVRVTMSRSKIGARPRFD